MQLLLLPLLVQVLTPQIAIEVPVFVNLGTKLPPHSLEQALDEVDRLFAEGGIRWRWQVSRGDPEDPAVVSVVVSSRPEHPVVSGCSRNRHDHRLGRTDLGLRRITLWTQQVARAVGGDWDRAELAPVNRRVLATALGRVLAHELGHLFLRLDGHRENGLMRPSFSYRTLTGRSDRPFRLSERDLERVRAGILRLQSSIAD